MAINQLTATQRPFSNISKSTFSANDEDSYYRQSAGISIMPTFTRIITLIQNSAATTRHLGITLRQTASA